MAIPENYIDKITKDGQSRMISPAADMVRVNSEEYEGDNLGDVLDEIADAVSDAASSADLSGLFAGVSYDSGRKEISFLDKGNNVVATLDAKPFVRDGMVSNVTLENGILTITFNTDAGKQPIEISLGDLFDADNYYTKAAADGKFVVQVNGKGLSTNDYTNADKAAVATIGNKADKNDVPSAYQPRLTQGTGISISQNNEIGLSQAAQTSLGKADTAVQGISVNGTPQTKTDGVVNIQSVAGTDGKSAYELAQQQGYQGTLQQWLASLKGQDGNSGVASGDGIASINNLNGGTTDSQSTVYVLGANQGKVIRDQIEFVYGQLRLMFAALGNIAFWGDKPSQAVLLPDLEWNNPKHTVTLALTRTNAVVKRNGVVVNNGDTLLIEEGATLTLTVEATSGHVLSSVTSTAGTVSQDLTTVTLVMGGSDVTLDITAVGVAEPSLSVSPDTLNLAAMANQSAIGQLTVVGSDLLDDVTVAATGTGIEICDTENGTYDSSLTLTRSSGSVNATIYVKFTAGSEGITGSITASSQGAANAVASVVGTVSELPSGYTKLKAIKPSSSGAYILTDFMYPASPSDFKAVLHATALTFGTSTPNPISGVNGNGRNILGTISAQGGQLNYHNYMGSGSPKVSVLSSALGKDSDGLYEIEYGSVDNTGYIKNLVSGTTTNASNASNSWNASEMNNKLTLFRADTYFGTGNEIARYKVYKKVSGTFVLQLDLIPCKNSSNVVGMYDRIGQKFYSSEDTSKTFTGIEM